jgi:hypothetical protein
MRHYDTRLDAYYEADDAVLVRRILDAYAISQNGLTVPELDGHLAAVDLPRRPGRDELVTIVGKLEADHYLRRSGSVDTMATSLLRRAWCWIRRLPRPT